MKRILTSILGGLLFITTAIPVNVQAMTNPLIGKENYSSKAINLRLAQRKLWSDHAFWTRNFIISDLANLDDKNKVLERLLRNQEDNGNSFKPYYGEENAKKLTALLKEHIIIAGQVVEAAKAGNKTDLEKYNKQWYENADNIADFLSKLNPNWPIANVKNMFYIHLQLLTDQVVARINKNWDEEILAYDKGYTHILMLADELTNGIIKQFPERFK